MRLLNGMASYLRRHCRNGIDERIGIPDGMKWHKQCFELRIDDGINDKDLLILVARRTST